MHAVPEDEPVLKTGALQLGGEGRKQVRTNTQSLTGLLSLLIFFCSGFSGLVFEVVWVRQAALGLGVTIWAVSVVVGSFMAGLALGSSLFGRLADRSPNCLALYAKLEGLIVLSGLAATAGLSYLPAWMVGLPTVPGSLLDRILQVSFIFLIVLVPTTLMGGTLPTLTRALADPERPSRSLGLLYAINTLGAVAAAFFTDWSLIPALGLTATTRVAAGLNLVAALTSLMLARLVLPTRPDDARAKQPRSLLGLVSNPLLQAYALSGFTAMGFEITWTRLLMMFARPSIYIFSVVLALYLAGISLGSFAAAGWSTRTRHPLAWLVACLGTVALASLGSMLWITPVNAWLSDGPLQQALQGLTHRLDGADNTVHLSMLSNGVRAAALFGIQTLLMGVAFPLAGRLAMERSPGLARAVGELYTANTLGAILGTLTTGFLILPALGVQRTLMLLACLTALAALRVAGSALTRGLAGAALLVCLASLALPGQLLEQRVYLPLWARNWGVDPSDVLYFADDSYGTVAVINSKGGPILMVNSTMMMGVRPEGQRYASLMGHLPAVLHPNPKKALVICFGTGMTIGTLSLHPELDSITCVELSPSVLAAAASFGKWNHDVIHSPRVHYVLADGRNYLLRTSERFDVITFEPPPPTQAGTVNLYSANYYALCRDRLTANGLVCQWVPLSLLDDPDLKMVIRAFLEVFPNAQLWEGSTHDYMLIGSPAPIRVDWERLKRGLGPGALGEHLASIGMRDPISLAATWMRGPKFNREYSASAPLVTDDHPDLEYSRNWFPRWSKPARTRELSELKPLLDGFTPERRQSLERRSATFQLLMDYRDSPLGRVDDSAARLQHLDWARRILADTPRDPYALYVLGANDEQMQELERAGDSEELAYHLLILGRWNEARSLLARLAPTSPSARLWQSWEKRQSGVKASE